MDESPHIPIHRKLEILGAAARYEELGQLLEEQVSHPWHRARGREAEVGLASSQYQIYERDETGERPGVLLFLHPMDSDVYVPNIVPVAIGEIDLHEYNRTIEDFAEQFIAPVARRMDLDWQLGPPRLDLSESLDERSFNALRLFSRTSNRSTGSSHPLDREKWMDFLILLTRSGRHLGAEHLEEWLILDGWPEEVAYDLALQYEFGMALLRREQEV